MTLSYFNFPPAVYQLLPYLGAVALGVVAWSVGGLVARRLSFGAAARLDQFSAAETEDVPAPMGSLEHRVRISLARFGIQAAGRERYYLNLARLLVGIGFTLLLVVLGFPILTSLVGFAAGWVFVNGWLVKTWNTYRTDIEAEIPALLQRLSSTLQTTSNVQIALGAVAETLTPGKPLRPWVGRLLSRMQNEGRPAIAAMKEEAGQISASLAIAVELIGRMWTTGGQGYAAAFITAAENIEMVLDARVQARAKGSGVQGTINILLGMTVLMMAFMFRNEAMGDVVRTPLVQVGYALVVMFAVYGYGLVSDMIDNAV